MIKVICIPGTIKLTGIDLLQSNIPVLKVRLFRPIELLRFRGFFQPIKLPHRSSMIIKE